MHCLHDFHQPHHRTRRRIFVWGVQLCCFLLLWTGPGLSNDTTKTSSLSTIDVQYVTQLRRELKAVKVAILYAEDALDSITDSTKVPNLLFHLSELEVRSARLRFELEMIKYNLKNQLFEAGKIKTQPRMPELSFARAIGINEQILENYSHAPFINSVLYRNSICYYESGQKDRAKEIFLQLIPQVKSDSLRDELTFRLGECFFEEHNYEKALISYNQILKSWNSPYFSMALYKIAWCQYLTNRIPDAISTFYYLLKDIRLLETMDTELLGKSQVELRDEVLQYIALSFSDFGGTRSLLKFIAENGDTEYEPFLLKKLGEIFFKRDFYEDALQALNYVKENFSAFERLPEVFSLIFKSYNRLGQWQKAVAARDEFVRLCSGASNWRLAHPYEEFRQKYREILAEMDYKIATPYLQSADSLFAQEQYKQALPRYRKFLAAFPKDKRCDHAQFCIAECFFSLGSLAQAANAYQKLIDEYPQSELFEDAAYNRVVCFDKMAERSAEKTRGLPFALITACEKFLELVPASERTVEIQLKLAEIYFQHQIWQESEKWAQIALKTILKAKRGITFKLNAIYLLAQIKFKLKDFKTAGAIFARLKQEKPDSTELVQFCDRMIASSQYKIGEKLRSRGRLEEAAQNFELTALRSADKEIARAAQFEAAVQYEKIGKYLKAAVNFESLYHRFPDTEQASEALYRAAELREKLEQYHLAAHDYKQLHKILGNNEQGAAALFKAGLALEKAGDWLDMYATFQTYADKFLQNKNRQLEALFKMAYASEQRHLLARAEMNYAKLLEKYRQFGMTGAEVDDEIAAKASFRLAEIAHEKFRSIKLVPPFQIHLTQKQTAFSDMLKKYVEVTKYNMAEWTTASFYQIGLAYEEFCQQISNSPQPPNLNAQQRKAYWTAIDNQLIIPLQLQAMKYYQANIRICLQNSIENKWTTRTRQQLMLLKQTLAQKNALPQEEQVKRAGSELPNRSQKRQRTL